MDEYKKCLMNILLWFHNYCVEHDLRYYLVEGTMLGAARHQGFIPWDDDIDVGMPRSDYDRFAKMMGDSVHDGRFKLETEDSSRPEYLYPFAKLYDATTTLIEKRRVPVVMGVYIDVFPLDGIGDTEEASHKNYKKIGSKQNLLAAKVVSKREGRKWYKNLAVSLVQILPDSAEGNKKTVKDITALCKQRDFDSSSYVGNLVSTYRGREIMARECYGVPTLYPFEGHELYGVENADAYLKHLYGDWRKLPPEDKRKSAHNMESIDLKTPFIDAGN